MHWNGAFASMLFLNHWEFTRNATFARETVYPLVAGLVSWWSCFLQRSNSSDGALILEDWNALDPDESGENQPVRNPMIGMAFAKRLASFQITLAKALFPTQPAPPEAAEIVRYLAPFPVASDSSPASKAVWSCWKNATIEQSGVFALYPLFPTELMGADSNETVLDVARRSVKQYTGPDTTHLAHTRPVEAFPAAVRAGYSHASGSGWQPREVLEGLDKMLSVLLCCNTTMLPVASGELGC